MVLILFIKNQMALIKLSSLLSRGKCSNLVNYLIKHKVVSLDTETHHKLFQRKSDTSCYILRSGSEAGLGVDTAVRFGQLHDVQTCHSE
ncbi:hypothetical protein Plhal304r1_c101g0174971 [Plasmopara halstedii]